jgi:hypothetical protein
VILTEWLHAEAHEAGRIIAQIAKSIENSGTPFTPPCVLLTTGELIVTVGENRGIGGRNQEFALSAALESRGSSRSFHVLKEHIIIQYIGNIVHNSSIKAVKLIIAIERIFFNLGFICSHLERLQI